MCSYLRNINEVSTRALRRYASADGSSTVAKNVADVRPSAAGRQRAYSLGSCAVGQTDGRIALALNAPYGERMINVVLR